jgi:hypothetical protein
MSSSASERADAASSTQPSTRVLRQFRVVFNSVKTHFRQVEREAGLGGAQLWALSVIQRRPASASPNWRASSTSTSPPPAT